MKMIILIRFYFIFFVVVVIVNAIIIVVIINTSVEYLDDPIMIMIMIELIESISQCH